MLINLDHDTPRIEVKIEKYLKKNKNNLAVFLLFLPKHSMRLVHLHAFKNDVVHVLFWST